MQIDGKNVNKGYTTGATKGRKATENYEKTVYNPEIWTNDKLEKALKEAVQDAINKNKGILPSKFNGYTSEGYEIEGYFKNGTIDTFYFK